MASSRRRFLVGSSMVASAGWLAARSTSGAVRTSLQAKASANERIRVGVMGASGRALSLIGSFSSNPSVEIVAIADVDSNRLPMGLQAAEKTRKDAQGRKRFSSLDR